MDKLASVILLCYRKFEYIFAAIDSILNQTYSEIELIVADDGSNNFPQNEITNYIREKKLSNVKSIIVYSNKENMGTVKNLNTAIKKSNGYYILVLSSDDELFDNTVISSVVKALDISKNGVITCKRMLCDQALRPIREMPTRGHTELIRKINTAKLQHRAFLFGEFYDLASGSCTYYKRERIYKDGLFNEKYRLLEDWSHFLEITRSIPIETEYGIISVKYRTGGISTVLPDSLVQDYLLMMRNELELYKDSMTRFEKRYTNYNIDRFLNRSVKIHIKYFDAFMHRLVYIIRYRLYSLKK